MGAGQHFVGLVNASRHDPVVYTVCPGPAGSGRTGPIAAGQTLSVTKRSTGRGYTGPFSQIYAWFVPRATQATPVQVAFATYGSPQPIPTSVRVPCDGVGKVEFSSCPYLAPCTYGWVPSYVRVRFVNMAA